METFAQTRNKPLQRYLAQKKPDVRWKFPSDDKRSPYKVSRRHIMRRVSTTELELKVEKVNKDSSDRKEMGLVGMINENVRQVKQDQK
jgi:hypothetical protein